MLVARCWILEAEPSAVGGLRLEARKLKAVKLKAEGSEAQSRKAQG
jgi:hypothetical protein